MRNPGFLVLLVLHAVVSIIITLILVGIVFSVSAQLDSEQTKHQQSISACNDMIDLMQISANDFASGLKDQGHLVYQEVVKYRYKCK